MARPVPVLSSVEFVLGYLWRGPASRWELLEAAAATRSPLIDREGLEAVIRGLRVQGLLREEAGRLYLVKERLHPMARRAAELVARDLELMGVVKAAR